jgi:hypothetical protein
VLIQKLFTFIQLGLRADLMSFPHFDLVMDVVMV